MIRRILQRQLSEIKNFQKPLHELTLTELFATSGCGETRPPPAGLALGIPTMQSILAQETNKQIVFPANLAYKPETAYSTSHNLSI